MNTYYNQNYTREEIDRVLLQIRECISQDRYTISLNKSRQENIDFINEYNIRSKKLKQILMGIKTDDFCHSLKNTNAGYEKEILYVFVPRVQLFHADGIKEAVDVYTKFNIIETPEAKQIVVISFHKLNRPIQYAFKKTKRTEGEPI